jgi:hypothetical protein
MPLSWDSSMTAMSVENLRQPIAGKASFELN